MGGAEARGEEKEALVGCAGVADEEVREDGAGGVVGGGGGLVATVPGVLHVAEDLGGVGCAEGEVSFCVVGLSFFGEEGADDMV